MWDIGEDPVEGLSGWSKLHIQIEADDQVGGKRIKTVKGLSWEKPQILFAGF